jgi:hypothetical protein
MPKAKKLPKYVTVPQHRAALMAVHQGTVRAVMAKLTEMEDRLRAEFNPLAYAAALDAPMTAADVERLVDAIRADQRTYEGNHLAPTTAEGAE